MKTSRLQRVLVALALIFAVLLVIGAVGMHAATRVLKTQIEQALGSDSEVQDIVVGWSSIELRGVRIRAPQGWPATDTLRAQRVIVRPDLLGLLTARVQVPRIQIEQAYLSVWRTRDGKLRLLPSLLEKPANKAAASTSEAPTSAFPVVRIGHIELQDGVVELFDSTIRQPAYKTRLEQLHAVVEDLQVPGLAGRTQLQIDGMVQGLEHNGRLAVDGWFEAAEKNSDIAIRFSGVDLLALQPYLIKASEIGVRHGTLDLKLKSSVHGNRLHAPGMVALNGLELAHGSGMLGTFMGMPRQAVIAALKGRKDQISIQFTLDGDLNDPHFSLNESLARRMGAAVAESLGISFEGLTRSMGEGVGAMMKKLFSK